MAPVKFVTLGPAGTNHQYVSEKYLRFRGLSDSALALTDTPENGLAAVQNGDADYFIICSVHPRTPRVVGKSFNSVFIVDTFISPSHPLAVITRSEVEKPTSIGVLSPSTDDYVDAGQWKSVVRVTTGTLHHVADGLLDGQYDSALIYASYADKYPERLRLDAHLGSPDDAWLVLGRERTFSGLVQACADGPIAKQLERRRLGAASA